MSWADEMEDYFKDKASETSNLAKEEISHIVESPSLRARCPMCRCRNHTVREHIFKSKNDPDLIRLFAMWESGKISKDFG